MFKLPRLRRAMASAGAADYTRDVGFVPPGHYYSPIPDFKEILRNADRIFPPWPAEIAGIDMNREEQVRIMRALARYYPDMPFGDNAKEGLRYYFDNQSYAYSDGVILHCMLRHLQPRRLVEVGSGFSSCVTLDTDERFLNGKTEITFIEPYPQLLH